jgi:hypothetical protein
VASINEVQMLVSGIPMEKDDRPCGEEWKMDGGGEGSLCGSDGDSEVTMRVLPDGFY